MFILDPAAVQKFDLEQAQAFVRCWRKRNLNVSYQVKVLGSNKPIDYIQELNIGKHLTEENVQRLLRWKDERFLSHKNLNKDTDNEKVTKVLRHLQELNKFRFDKSSDSEFKKLTGQIFPGGFIWQIFLFHICEPARYPIADQNVFRVYDYHTKSKLKVGWEKYEHYKDYFYKIVKACNIERGKDTKAYVLALKQIDDALKAFGQFLGRYLTNTTDTP